MKQLNIVIKISLKDIPLFHFLPPVLPHELKILTFNIGTHLACRGLGNVLAPGPGLAHGAWKVPLKPGRSEEDNIIGCCCNR